MSDNFGALEADFRREYRLDLRDELYGPNPMGMGQLWSLVTGLSAESAVAQIFARRPKRVQGIEALAKLAPFTTYAPGDGEVN